MSEYKALYEGTNEIVWLRQIKGEIGIGVEIEPTVIFEDCQPAIDYAHNPVNQSRMRGLKILYHSTRDSIAQGDIQILKISTIDQIADIFTKPLSRMLFLKFRSLMLKTYSDEYSKRQRLL